MCSQLELATEPHDVVVEKGSQGEYYRRPTQEFERFGEGVLAQAFAVGADRTQGPDLLNVLQRDRAPLLAWLTERRDIHERKEDRLETVEWAILIFVIVGVLADILIVVHELR